MTRRTSGLRATNPFWTKSPFVLLRFPTLLAALAAGVLLLVLAGASYPLFTSAASSEALGKEIDAVIGGRFGAGLTIRRTDHFYRRTPAGERVLTFAARDEVFDRFGRSVDGVAPRVLSAVGPVVQIANPQRRTRDLFARLVAKTGALDHVEKVSGTDGDGLWIADVLAGYLRVRAGDEVVLEGPEGRRGRIEIDGVYRALFNEPRTPYWTSLAPWIYPPNIDSPAPPSFLIGDEDQIAALATALGQRSATFVWDLPLATAYPPTLDEAARVNGRLQGFVQRMRNTRSEIGRAFGCTGYRCFFRGPRASTRLPQVTTQARRRIAVAEGPVRMLLTAGVLVALAVIAAAGAFAASARATENRLLFARGLNPLKIAARSVLESLLPAAAGTAAGLGLAFALVQNFGPRGPIDSAAVEAALQIAAVAVPLAVVLLAAVATMSFSRQSEAGSSRLRVLASVPWELLILAGSIYALTRVLAGEALIEDEASGVARPSLYLLLFPILFIAGLGGVVADGLQALLRSLRERSGRLGAAAYLVVHRLADAPRLTILLFTSGALALGVFVYAQTMAASVETTTVAKSLLFVGSDVQGTIDPTRDMPADFPFPSTKVTRLPARATLVPGGISVDLLAIDPATFASAVYWDEQFGAASLEDLVARLDAGGPSLPIVVAGRDVPSNLALQAGEELLGAEVVAEVPAFPALSSARPLVVVSAQELRERLAPPGAVSFPLGEDISSEIWIRGDPTRIVDALAALEDPIYYVLTAEEVQDIPSISAVQNIFGVLKLLGLGAGLLVIVVIVMYLQARQRRRVVSYALSRRMGLSHASHRVSLVAELGGMLVSSYLLGTGLALFCARLVIGDVDPLRTIPPGPLFVPPLWLIGATVVVLVGVSAAAGALANRSAEQTDFAQVMRLAA